ncbi:hypothetical protein DPMN_159495 [Dreissena polymorpha]|uniref:Uncharacterized protein n=1 Tax=Dreissena polymorpha TaxID=45954 RepID=A0A9D4IMW1_DREPO|nr:hypothetical protein DPMN_159495 [Dreissena polymorpha]
MSNSGINMVTYHCVVRDSVPDVLQSYQQCYLHKCSERFHARCPAVVSTWSPTLVSSEITCQMSSIRISNASFHSVVRYSMPDIQQSYQHGQLP